MNLVDLIKQDEGLRLKPYKCTAGKLTIGWGRNLEDRGITEDEAEWMLENDINDVFLGLDKRIGYFRNLSEVRQAVLANMALNLGLNGLLGFKKMLAAVEAGRYVQAATEMKDSLWARQVPNRAERLAEMMLGGKWPARWEG